jgi:DNA polymerase III psi subunit
MSLDNILLPGFIIQDLYQKSLVDLDGAVNNKPSKSNEINFFGGNKQQIVLLVNNPDTTFISDEQLTFLSGILTACKLSFEDVALINIATLSPLSYKNLSENFKPTTVIMFGISPEVLQLPFVMPEFQRQSYNNQVYLSVPDLNNLEKNKELKRKLWTVLQQIFSL